MTAWITETCVYRIEVPEGTTYKRAVEIWCHIEDINKHFDHCVERDVYFERKPTNERKQT